jgi:hypothetical protein
MLSHMAFVMEGLYVNGGGLGSTVLGAQHGEGTLRFLHCLGSLGEGWHQMTTGDALFGGAASVQLDAPSIASS